MVRRCFEFGGICESGSSYSERLFMKAEGITVNTNYFGLEKSIAIERKLEYCHVAVLMTFFLKHCYGPLRRGLEYSGWIPTTQSAKKQAIQIFELLFLLHVGFAVL